MISWAWKTVGPATLVAAIAWGQVAAFEGRVVDPAAQALPGVQVRLGSSGALDTTDSAGIYSFPDTVPTSLPQARTEGGLSLRIDGRFLRIGLSGSGRHLRASLTDQRGKILWGRKLESPGEYQIPVSGGGAYVLSAGPLFLLLAERGVPPRSFLILEESLLPFSATAAGIRAMPKRTAQAPDTLHFSKDGYQPGTLPFSQVQGKLVDFTLSPIRPPVPESLALEAASPRSIRVRWRLPADTAVRIIVQRGLSGKDGFAAVAERSAPANAYLDTGLAEGTLYFYRAIAKSWLAESTPSGVDSMRTPLEPRYAVTVAVNPAGSGQVVSQSRLTELKAGTAVTLSAVPASGFVFANWSGSASLRDTQITITVTRDTTVTAFFARVPILSVPAVVTEDFSIQWTFDWGGASGAADHFELETSESVTSGWSLFVTTPPGAISRISPYVQQVYLDMGDANKTYYYRVRAQVNGAYTPYSAVASTRVGALAAPTIRIVNDLYDGTSQSGIDWGKLNTIVRVRVGPTESAVTGDASLERLEPLESATTSVFTDQVEYIVPKAGSETSYATLQVAGDIPNYSVFIQTGWWELDLVFPTGSDRWIKRVSEVLCNLGACCCYKWAVVNVTGHRYGRKTIKASDFLPAGNWNNTL